MASAADQVVPVVQVASAAPVVLVDLVDCIGVEPASTYVEHVVASPVLVPLGLASYVDVGPSWEQDSEQPVHQVDVVVEGYAGVVEREDAVGFGAEAFAVAHERIAECSFGSAVYWTASSVPVVESGSVRSS